jgi:hypothetical protein
MTEKQKQYVAAEQQFIKMTNLKVGSKVRVTNIAKDNQHGWNNIWDEDMTEYVNKGKEHVVMSLNKSGRGISLGEFSFPFFTLEVMDETIIKVSDDYDAIINQDGSIQVGCQTIQYKDLKAVYEAATKNYKPVVKKKAPAKKKPYL